MARSRIEIVGIGIACLDHAIRVDRFPRDDRTHVLEYRRAGGGMAATATVAAQRLGARCGLASVVGCDEPGRFVRRELQDEGVDVRYVRARRRGQTFTSFCLAEAASGQKMIMGCPTDLRPLGTTDVDKNFWKMLQRCSLLHLDGWHEELTLEAAERARRAGVLVSFDATSVRSCTESILGCSDIVFASASFVRQFCKRTSYAQRLRTLKAAAPRARWVGVTIGANGSLATDNRGRQLRQPAFRVTVADSVGAGDAYHGAIAYAAIRGWSLARAMRLASAVGAMCCTQLSGRTGLPSLRQVQRFLARHREGS
jgi:sulfofructose kinase